jgi:hypothetical protein
MPERVHAPGEIKSVLLRWEKYRVVYNIVVATPILALSNRTMIHAWTYWRMILLVLLFANLLLFVGHVSELLTVWAKGPHRGVGTGVMILVTIVAFLGSLGSIGIY